VRNSLGTTSYQLQATPIEHLLSSSSDLPAVAPADVGTGSVFAFDYKRGSLSFFLIGKLETKASSLQLLQTKL